MESSDNFNFSIFRPRNLHGRKNRNVILTLIGIWAVAVFGFQFLLRAIEKPVPEPALTAFNKVWPAAEAGSLNAEESKILLNSLIMARGKVTLTASQKQILAEGISVCTYHMIPDSLKSSISSMSASLAGMHETVTGLTGDPYLEMKKNISIASKDIVEKCSDFTGVVPGSLEASILGYSLGTDKGMTFSDPALTEIPAIMHLYMTHNQSVLTDTIVLGFPFHYFYSGVFLLVMFVVLCIVYNILIEKRLSKEGITE